jgi:multidrug efflux pump subunit AcrA (membrane-fusion protein)
MSRLDESQARLDAALSRLEAALNKAPNASQTAYLAAALEQAQQERITLREKADIAGIRLDETIGRLRRILGDEAGQGG